MQSIKMMEKKGIALFFLSKSTVAGFAQSPINDQGQRERC